jgi:outer membrane protein TolC
MDVRWPLVSCLSLGCAVSPAPARLALAVARAPTVVVPAPPLDEGPLDRAALLRAVISRDSARVAAAQRARAALEDADAARALPSPEFGAQLWNVPWDRPWDLGRAQMVMLELRQTFSTAGLRGARASQRIAEAEAALAELTAREQELHGRAATAWAELVASARHHAVHVAHLEVVDAMTALVRARLGASTTNLAAVTRVEAERARVLQRIARFEGARTRSLRALNGLLRRPADAPLAAVADAPVSAVDAPVDALVAAALTLRGELRARDARVRAAQAMHAEARAEATEPMVTAGFSAWFDPHTAPGYGLSASTTLPWLWGGGAARARAAALRADAESLERDARAAEIRAEVIDAHAELQSAASALEALRRNAIPAADRSLDAARAAFAGGNGPLAEWLDAARMRVDLGDEEADGVAELLRATAALEARVGAALPLLREARR